MKYFVPFLLVFYISVVAAQQCTKAIITNVQFDYDLQNDNVIISLQLSGTIPSELFTITLESIKVLSGERLKINSVFGDTGKISGDGIKTIIWHQRKDGYVIDEEIGIKVNAYVKPEIPMFKHLLRSAFIPGLGDYRIRNGWHYITFGTVSYGLIASSVYFNSLALKNYNNYKSSFDVNESDRLFEQSVKQKQLSYLVAGVAAAIWVADIAGVFSKSKKLQKCITAENSRYYYTLSQQPIVGIASSKQLNTKNNYERAMEKGDRFFKESKYPEALNEFEQVLKFNPADVKAKNKIDETKKIIADIKAKEQLFQKLVTEGDSLFWIKNYYSAQLAYRNALKIEPNNKIVSGKLTQTENMIQQARVDSLYSVIIKNAEYAFSKKEYAEAKKIFHEASLLNAWDEYPKTKIIEIDSIQEVLAKKKIDDEYNSIIKQADVALINKQYEKAKELYFEGYNIKSVNDYPNTQIRKIDAIISDIEQKQKDKEYISCLDKGDDAMKKREYDKARNYYEKATQLKPIESYPKRQIESIDNLFNMSKTYGSKEELFNNCEKAVFLIFSESYLGEVSTGTGFFITSDGIGISNYHVYNKYQDAVIYTGGYVKSKDEIDNEKIFEIEKVIDQNETKDYVIFKVKKKYIYQKFNYLKIATQNPKILDDVLAIGNPKSFLKVPSPGVIKQYLQYEGIDNYYILTNVDVTYGNSGGPLLNLQGEALGIMTMAVDQGRLGLNYAINIQKLNLSWLLK